MYALAATLVWGRIVFGVPLHFVHPLAVRAALPATVISLGLMGLVLASTFILYRYANALSNLLEYPVWIASGLVFSTSVLPGGHGRSPGACRRTGASSRCGTRRSAARCGLPLAMTAMLGLASRSSIATFTFRRFEHLARARATLSLT